MNIKCRFENFSQQPKIAPVLLNWGDFSISSLAVKSLLYCILARFAALVL